MSSRRTTSQNLSSLTPDARHQMLLSFVSERESDYARLARFLHDEVGQVLSAVGLQMDALRHDFGPRIPELDQRAVDIQEMLETIIGRIRDLSYELNPSIVQRIGLQFALDRLVTRFRTRFSGSIRAHLDPAVRVPHDRAEAMYRGAEAALELATSAPDCTEIDVQLKRNRTDFIVEIRANAPVDFEAQSSFPALLMNYYANRSEINLTVIPSGENDTIVRFSYQAAA
jgi:signal transduction histidine kinase